MNKKFSFSTKNVELSLGLGWSSFPDLKLFLIHVLKKVFVYNFELGGNIFVGRYSWK